MFNKSKLQNAKQKISKLKEKYLNSSNLTKDDYIINLLSSTELLYSSKTDEDKNKVDVLNPTVFPVNEFKSPRIEITNLFDDDADHTRDEKISPQSLSNSHILIDDHHSNVSSNLSTSEHSYCSKVTNKTLKTESIVLSDLSNQFEHICFLSSSSDEENATELRPTGLSVPLAGRNLGLLQKSIQSFDRDSEPKQSKDVLKRDTSSSELSEVQSDVNSSVSRDKEESAKMYSQPVKFETNNVEDSALKKEESDKDLENSENSAYKTMSSNKSKTLTSDPKFEFNSSIQTEDNSTESSEKFKTNSSPLKEIKPPQIYKNTHAKQKSNDRKNKIAKPNYVSNLKVGTTLTKYENRQFNGGEVTYSKDIGRTTVPDENRLPVQTGVSSFPKTSRRTHTKRSKTVSKHSTSLKPSKNRPILKSCVLIRNNEFSEVNELLFPQRISTTKLDGSGYEEVIKQLLWNQVQLTRHFIHSHHQMYLTCCQAVKALSEEYNNNCHIT